MQPIEDTDKLYESAATALARRGGIAHTSDLSREGVHPAVLTSLWRAGRLIRLKAGLYQLPEALPSQHAALVQASYAVPHGIICLTSALDFHGLTDANPDVVFVAIPMGTWAPTVDEPPLHIVRFRPHLFEIGVEQVENEGHQVRVTSREKTLCDCLRMVNLVGLETTLIALRRYLRSPRGSAAALLAIAKQCRVARRLKPYLEALTA